MQVDIALKSNRSAQPEARRDHEFSAASLCQRCDGFGERFRIECFSITNRAEISQVGDSVGDGRFFDSGQWKPAGRIIRGSGDKEP
jgi:hypothetical protein